MDAEEKALDFGTWLFRAIKKKVNNDRDQQAEEWRFQWDQHKDSTNLYLWTVMQVNQRAQALHRGNTVEAENYFQHAEHLHLINRNKYVVIVFTNKREVRESDFGDKEARTASRVEAKAASSVKHHQGGFSDDTSYFVANRIPGTIADAPDWQIALVKQLQDKFVYQQFMEDEDLYEGWMEQWKEYLSK